MSLPPLPLSLLGLGATKDEGEDGAGAGLEPEQGAQDGAGEGVHPPEPPPLFPPPLSPLATLHRHGV